MGKKQKRLLVLVASMFLLISVHVMLPVQALQGKILIPVADSDVWSEGPNGNRGREWNLFIRGGGSEILSFLMFDLSEIPSGAVVDDTKLRLYTNGVSIKAAVDTYYCSNDDWTEDGITYNNRPSFSPNIIGTLNVTNGMTWYEWNVTDAAQTALGKADKKLSIVLKTDTYAGDLAFRSKDNPWATPPYPDTRPKLEVLYVAPPPSGNDPALTWLIVILVVGAAAIGLELTIIRLKRRRSTYARKR